MDREIVEIKQEVAAADALAKHAHERLDDLTTDLSELVTHAVEKAIASQPRLTEEEREFLTLAVKAQAQRVKLRQAIIEKTVPGLVWAGISLAALWLKSMFEEWAKSKGVTVPWK